MLDETIVALLAALLGAVVGGACTLLGSIHVSKLELTRSARLRLTDEVLPRFRQHALPAYRRERTLGNFKALSEEYRILLRAATLARLRKDFKVIEEYWGHLCQSNGYYGLMASLGHVNTPPTDDRMLYEASDEEFKLGYRLLMLQWWLDDKGA